MANRSKCTPKKKDQFLAEIILGRSVSAGASACAVSRRSVYSWREADDEFARRWDEAIEQGTDLLEDKAKEQAVDGNTTLLIFLLKARRPDKYRERSEVVNREIPATPKDVAESIKRMGTKDHDELRKILDSPGAEGS